MYFGVSRRVFMQSCEYRTVLRVSFHLSRSLSIQKGPMVVYNERVQQGLLRDDSAQREALEKLDKLHKELVTFDERRKSLGESLNKISQELYEIKRKEENLKELFQEKNRGGSWFYGNARKISLFGNVFKKAEQNELSQEDKERRVALLQLRDEINVPKGLYMYGGPGSGKTYLMELFYRNIPIEGKRRVHFHEFMLEVHRTLHSLSKTGRTGDEMMQFCVDAVHQQGWLLCFDEFQVTDIADAMVMRRLFENLWLKGMVIIATSNRSPDELYKNGIQRDLFIPFINELKSFCEVKHIMSEVDYRMQIFDSGKNSLFENLEETVYFVTKGNNIKEKAKFERLWDAWTKGDVVHTTKLRVQGREIQVPQAARYDDIARFSFEELCGKPLGPADYYAIASSFHTVFIEKIPKLPLTKLNQIRRFITLIDSLYDQQVVVCISADVPMDELLDLGGATSEEAAARLQLQEEDLIADSKYNPTKGNVDEVFAFDRTLSRLHEMQKPEYLQHPHDREQRISPVRFFSNLEISASDTELSEEEIRLIWERYDKNNDGVIDKQELVTMLSEITLYTSGHRHVPIEVVETTEEALLQGTDEINWQSFKDYFGKYGISTRL